MQTERSHQGRVHRRVRVHADGVERREVLRHREPDPAARVVQTVHADDRRSHMGTGRGAGRAVGHVLARGHVPDPGDQRDHRVLLPVPVGAGRRLREEHGRVQSADVLRSTAVRDRLLLLADVAPPDGVHAQHAGRAAARGPVRSNPRPEEGGQDGAVVRHHIHGQLPAVPRVHGVVPLLSELARRVRRLLARVPHRRLLPELHQLVREPGRPVLHQRRVPQALQPLPVLLLPVRPSRRRRRRVHRPRHQLDARQQRVRPAPQLGHRQPQRRQPSRDMTAGRQVECSAHRRRRRRTRRGLQRRLTGRRRRRPNERFCSETGDDAKHDSDVCTEGVRFLVSEMFRKAKRELLLAEIPKEINV